MQEWTIVHIQISQHYHQIVVPFSWGGWLTTTCMVVIPPGTSHSPLLHSPTVLLFSNICPALIIFKSFTVLGAFALSVTQKKGQLYTSMPIEFYNQHIVLAYKLKENSLSANNHNNNNKCVKGFHNIFN